MIRVLVIDDEKEITGLLERALTVAGFDVVVASNGHEGIERYIESYFDLVITDGEMPHLGGRDVLNYIRQSNRPETPVIGISATPWVLTGQDFDVILPKPFSLKTLLNQIEEISLSPLLAASTV
jgi:CheY-like chemotaxis protein